MKKFLMMGLMAGAMFMNAPKAVALPCCQPGQDPTTCTPCGGLGCVKLNQNCMGDWPFGSLYECCDGLSCTAVGYPGGRPQFVCKSLL